jgi:hypothetical protein
MQTDYDTKNGLDLINFDFLSKFKVVAEKAASKLVYHINVIDELHANENAHSRILAKLLQQSAPESKRFEILESFVQFLQKKSPDSFGNIAVDQPNVTQEAERIDLWIRDKNYAIIVENKIYWAGDQAAQIERYIDTTRSYGYAEAQIYVVYLTPVYDKEPDRQTWGKYYDSELHRERYVQLSFREDILLWLKESVLPNVRIKDTYLRSAIEQYIDCLEGIFDLRTINKQINMELQEFIKKELGLNGTPQENVAKLLAKEEELSKVNSQLQLLKDEAEKTIFREWQSALVTDYRGYELVAEEGTRAGILIPVGDNTVRVSISFDSKLYCQVDIDHLVGAEKILPESVKAKLEHILDLKNNNGQIWKYFPRYAYNDVFKCLIDVIKILTK